ncbi:hypothetical protein [Herbidospora cretacea]|uniref:hypothetical protein n=1 Tax=Herbidospora cretacea TaxID=28444 RepID=UPI0004C33D64|nr:hypothetical protein [Herbidospora cretacea]
MRRTSGIVAGLMLLAPLAVSVPASAAPALASAAKGVTAKKAPFATFKVHNVVYPKKVKAGAKITYYFEITNVGPHSADYYYIGGILPKGIISTLKWNGPKNTTCTWEGNEFWCWPPPILYPNPEEDWQTDTTWLTIQVTLNKKTRGTATAKLGGITFDVPTGAGDLDEKRLRELGIKGWIYTKTVKTQIVAPSVKKKKSTKQVYVPPPPPPPKPDRAPTRNRKKGT